MRFSAAGFANDPSNPGRKSGEEIFCSLMLISRCCYLVYILLGVKKLSFRCASLGVKPIVSQ